MDQPAGFSPATRAALARAEALCAGAGLRLTALRRDVLGLILDADAPVGAYEILDRLRASRGGAAPPSVYRALDFLSAQGLVHRVERLAAFVACVAEPAPHAHAHPAQFLICRDCGRTIELADPALAAALAAAAARRGFTIAAATIEAEGRCHACAERTEPCP